jgi:hypothetical protein
MYKESENQRRTIETAERSADIRPHKRWGGDANFMHSRSKPFERRLLQPAVAGKGIRRECDKENVR